MLSFSFVYYSNFRAIDGAEMRTYKWSTEHILEELLFLGCFFFKDETDSLGSIQHLSNRCR